jgi:ATP-dependent RNA helicase RhlE
MPGMSWSRKKFFMSFNAFDLHPSLLRAVADSGYVNPTPIQTDAIPPALEGRDVLGCAMTGSGKTAAFVLPILQRLLAQPRGATRALILTPTRELAAQVQGQLEVLGKFTGVRSAAVFGGVPMPAQTRAFQSGVDVIVATPGRLLDHFQHGYAKLAQLEVLVFDEADRMLDMGFMPDIKRVLKHIPKPKQTLFFSATMPTEIAKLAKELLRNPVTLNAERQAMPASGVTQSVFPVSQESKPGLLLALLHEAEIGNVIVFTRTKHRANKVAKFLMARGVNAERIHGDRSQNQRTEALAGFKSGKYRVLVATDIAARGIDVEALEHVINFDVPAVPEDYIHRVGRTARAERTGEALTFVAPDEESQLRDIEKAIKTKLPRETLPGFDYHAAPPKQPAPPRAAPRTPTSSARPKQSQVQPRLEQRPARPAAVTPPRAQVAASTGSAVSADNPARANRRRRRGGRGRGRGAQTS